MSNADQTELTPRETQAVRSLVEKGKAKLVAKELGIETSTAEAYLMSARRKLGVNGAVQLAVKFDRMQRETEAA